MAKKTNRFLNYFKEVKGELKKVVWPSFKQVKNNTLIVIACVVIIGIFIALLDGVFSLTFGKVIEKLQGGEAVEQTTDGSTEMTEEEYQAAMEQMLAGVGVTVDESGKYFDAETKAELTQEEVDARLNSMLEASGLKTEETATEGTNTETNTAE